MENYSVQRLPSVWSLMTCIVWQTLATKARLHGGTDTLWANWRWKYPGTMVRLTTS